MTEIVNIRELKNCGSEKGQGNIVEKTSVFDEVWEAGSEFLKEVNPMEAEIGVDYQSMS